MSVRGPFYLTAIRTLCAQLNTLNRNYVKHIEGLREGIVKKHVEDLVDNIFDINSQIEDAIRDRIGTLDTVEIIE